MASPKTARCRSRLTVQGLVQGVGFRPFVYRLATELNLTGGVKNTSQGVVIEIEGDKRALEQFDKRLRQDLPPHASIQSIQQQAMPAERPSHERLGKFEIWASQTGKSLLGAQILPDLATCPDCLQDILNPQARRYHYPFTNCTHCGPRYSIVTALPYDRQHTTMGSFPMCPACEAEYTDPTQRRFHAQPNACPDCGPALSFRQGDQNQQGSPIENAVAALRQGKIVAVKGLGGFQLLVDAQNAAAVERLRARKNRPDKPLAVMYPNLGNIRCHCTVSESAERLLTSAQAPIVLLPQRSENSHPLATVLAPNSPYLGVMLPTTPLHHLLLSAFSAPVVATSGNRSGEPICIHEDQAGGQLGAIADTFLIHNRPIQRPVDDSVVNIIQGQPQILRHARGYAPQRIQVHHPTAHHSTAHHSTAHHPIAKDVCVLALGAHLKSAIALSIGDNILLSQHIGDLTTLQSRQHLEKTVTDFLSLHGAQPTHIACDLHPDYASTQLAQVLSQRWHLPIIPSQHHYAHILSCIAEHQLSSPVLGIAWDGTGYGTDHTIWGGEFLQTTDGDADPGFNRVAHFLPYYLPGGEACSLEPRRSALGLLYRCYGKAAFEMTDLAPMQAFTKTELTVISKMLTQKINTPVTSSVGRLFDGIAALLNLHHAVSFEGQAALTLEFAATQSPTKLTYPFTITEAQPRVIDWRPMVKAIVCDCQNAVMTPVIAAKFHNTLVEIMVAIAQRVGTRQVVMAGGCFQNTVLLESAIQQLQAEGFTPYWPQRIPPNDGGLAVGQVLAAWRYLAPVDSYGASQCA